MGIPRQRQPEMDSLESLIVLSLFLSKSFLAFDLVFFYISNFFIRDPKLINTYRQCSPKKMKLEIQKLSICLSPSIEKYTA